MAGTIPAARFVGRAAELERLHGAYEAARNGDPVTLVTGGEQKGPGYFYAPTLLSNVEPDSEIAQEEVFGPVAALIPA